MNKTPVIVSYGGGVDSTAALVGMWRRGERPDRIYFADVGGEKPETYHFIFGVMQPWLAEIGFPAIEVVRLEVETFANDPYTTLQGNCLSNSTLPGAAFGFGSCSEKWKGKVIDAAVDRAMIKLGIARRVGKRIVYKRQVNRVLGYDAGPADIRRKGKPDTDKYRWVYPLREWGWDRERCMAEIRWAGLPVPMKSACYFCPASSPSEIIWLAKHHPELARGIVEIERRAAVVQTDQPKKGLWGEGVKGMRGAERKPPRMTTFLAELGYDYAQAVDFDAIEAATRMQLAGREMPALQEKRRLVDAVLEAVAPKTGAQAYRSYVLEAADEWA